MKKNKKDKSDARNSHDYLNFVRRNQQIAEDFRELSKLQKQYTQHPKRNSSTIHDNKKTLQTDRYAGINSIHHQGFKRIYSNKQSSSLKDFILPANKPQKRSTQLPPNYKKQYLTAGSNAGRVQLYTRNLSIPTNIEHVKTLDAQNQFFPQIKFPRIINKSPTNFDHKFQSEVLQKQIISVKRRKTLKQQKGSKFTPIMLNNSKKTEEQLEEQDFQRAKIKSLKFSDLQKSKLNNKIIRTYYDYQNVMDLQDKVSQLLPSFKPLQPKKKQRIQILQLHEEYQGQLESFLQTSKAKKYIRQRKSAKKQDSQIKSIPEQKQEEKQEQKQEEEKKEESKNETQPKKKNSVHKKKQKQKQKEKDKKQALLFKSNGQQQTIYHQKIKSYRQFLFLVNFAHRIFDPLILVDDPDKYKSENKYKYYVGKGNNSMLIKSLMKRRFWWQKVDDPKNANFVWTQLKINNYYQFQKKSFLQNKYDKLDEDYQYQQSKLKKNRSLAAKKFQIKKNESPQKVSGIIRGNIPEGEKKIFTKADNCFYKEMLEKGSEYPQKFVKFPFRLKCLPENFLTPRQKDYKQNRVHNHFLKNYYIGNKKALFYNLKRYYDLLDKNVYDVIPLTYHIKNGLNDPEYSNFLREYKRLKSQLMKAQKSNTSIKKLSKNVWIVKPGQLSNRGNGITVIDEIYQLNTILKTKTKHSNGTDKTYIVQKYIEKPLLYKNRKFDIRHFMLLSRLHGRLRAYWFSEGYIRTSSYEYDIEDIGNSMIHLTNDAIQKGSVGYGKHEEGNKISYAEFQRYIDTNFPDKKYSFIQSAYPKMKQIAADSLKATYLQMDPDETEHNFEIFGLDFMIDTQFNVWLIQVNTNPCLQLSSNLLSRIIPTFMEHTFRLAIDPIFPPTAHFYNNIKYLAPDNPLDRLQFQLIFDEGRDGKEIEALFKNAEKLDCGQIDEDDETYENEGKQIQLGGDIE